MSTVTIVPLMIGRRATRRVEADCSRRLLLRTGVADGRCAALGDLRFDGFCGRRRVLLTPVPDAEPSTVSCSNRATCERACDAVTPLTAGVSEQTRAVHAPALCPRSGLASEDVG